MLFVRDPGGTEISEKIRSVLLDANHAVMGSMTEFYLYEAARSQMVHELVLPAVQKNQIVIADRFTDSTLTYQGYGRGLSLKMIQKANAWACQGLQIDLTFYLDITWQESLRRRRALNKSEDRMENQHDGFFDKVRSGYMHIAEKESDRVHFIDGMQSVESVFNQIYGRVKNKITS